MDKTALIDFGNPYFVSFFVTTLFIAHLAGDVIVLWLMRGASLTYFMAKPKRRPVMRVLDGRRARFALPKLRGPKLWRTKTYGTHQAPDESIYFADGGVHDFTVLGATGSATVPEYAAMCNVLVANGIKDIEEADAAFKKNPGMTIRLPLKVWCNKHHKLLESPEELKKHLDEDDHKKGKHPLKGLEFVSQAIKWEDYAKFQKYNENPAYTDSAIEHGISAGLAALRKAPWDVMKIVIILIAAIIMVYMVMVLFGQGGFLGGGGGGGGTPPQTVTSIMTAMGRL